MTPLGAHIENGGVRFAVRSASAERIWVCLFRQYSWEETDRIELSPGADGVFSGFVGGLGEGDRYGLRADGRYDPAAGDWFDPRKLLVDPYATRLDHPYVYNASFAAPRWQQADASSIVPKALVTTHRPVKPLPPLFRPGGLIYEISVRAFTMRHPAVPEEKRGTIAALAEPVVIEHLKKIGVDAVELMPVTAAIDERHLQPLGLRNAWGYNPVTFMPLDPRLAPGGIDDLRKTVAALRDAGIGVILDLVFNHTGESDVLGPTLSFRGLDNRSYYRHRPDGSLVNDTGCGNTVDCANPAVVEMVLASLRHFALNAGVDGFRFDLAPVLGRVDGVFDPNAPLLAAIRTDPVLMDRVLIAEPWDVGPDGYRLGDFGEPFLEWNDRARDDMRRFWRGDRHMVGALATRLAGSSDVFGRDASATRTVNFLAAHDGMTLADLTAYERRHNKANGEENRDGHHDNLSWNNGVEGETADPAVNAARRQDATALLATLFASRGTIMLTAGDEFGRSQGGNNNAYAQDNAVTWLDWIGRDRTLEDHVAELAALRRGSALASAAFLTGGPGVDGRLADVEWLTEAGLRLEVADWESPERRRLSMLLGEDEGATGRTRLAVMVNGDRRAVVFTLPSRPGYNWTEVVWPENGMTRLEEGGFLIGGRAVVFAEERPEARGKR